MATGTAKPASKSEVVKELADKTGLSRKQIGQILETLGDLIRRDLKKGPGAFSIPGLVKLKAVKKPATKAREGRNPFTGEMQMFKAKPARTVVKAVPLKGLKDAVV